MSATPKHKRSKRRQRNRRSQPDYKITTLPQLITLPSGKRVPRHMVTVENPIKKGVRFLPSKKIDSAA
jgi:ribosomal protein L32